MTDPEPPRRARRPEEHVSTEEAVTRPSGIPDLEERAGEAEKELLLLSSSPGLLC